jgi:O-antigen/teichoic acid export membrane protein
MELPSLGGAGGRVARNALFMLGQNVLVTVISIFVTAIIARHLGKTEFGIFNFSFSFVNLFLILSALGLRAVTVRSVAQKKEAVSEYVGLIFALRLMLATVAIPVLLGISYFINRDALVFTCVAVASLSLIFNAVSTTLRDVFQGFEKLSYEAGTAVVIRVFTGVGTILVFALGGGLVSVVTVYMLGSAAGSLVPYFGFRKHGIRIQPWIRKSEALAEMRKALPFALSGVVVLFMSKINPVLLGAFSTQEMVGIYSAAAVIMVVLQTIPDSIATSLYPTVARGHSDGSIRLPPILQRVFFYMSYLSVPIAIGGYIAAPSLIPAIFGKQFVESVPVFQVLILTLPLDFLSLPANYVLGAIHRQRNVVAVYVTAALVNIALNALLVPRMGAVGSAYASLSSSVLACSVSCYVLSRHYRWWVGISRYARLALANAVMGLVILPVRHEHPLWIVLGGMAAYAVATVTFRILTWSQILGFTRQSMGLGFL